MAGLDIFLEQTAPEIALRSLFTKYDVNNDNYLDRNELKKLFEIDLGLNAEQMEIYEYILDKDGDSVISYEEFREWIISKEGLKNITDVTRYHYLRTAIQMFQSYDTDGNMYLDRDEVKKLLIDSGGVEEHLDEAIKQLDTDENGRISFQEFVKWLNWAPIQDLFCQSS